MSNALALLIPAAVAAAAALAARPGRGGAGADLAQCIDALLPQTQCGQCGYPGCRPYAEAIARGAEDIDRCPPGGEVTLRQLARLLGRDSVAGSAPPPAATAARVARIDENDCIGCLKCVRACPVDAILGARGQMHTVIPDFCTGCELCVDPCPVDCIAMASP